MLNPEIQKYISLAPFEIPSLFDVHFEEYLAPYLHHAQPLTVPKGQIILHPDQHPRQVLFLMEGIAADRYYNANGLVKTTLIFPCYPMALFALAHQQPILYTSAAYTDTKILAIDYDTLLAAMQDSQTLLTGVLKLFSLECRNANNIVLQTHASSSTQRIYQTIYLYHLTQAHYPPLSQVPPTQHLLAELAGVHRTSIANAIKTLKEEGLITVNGRKGLTVLAPEQLKQLAFDE